MRFPDNLMLISSETLCLLEELEGDMIRSLLGLDWLMVEGKEGVEPIVAIVTSLLLEVLAKKWK